MTWGPYYFFYICSKCGKRYRWILDDMSEADFSNCPECHIPGELVGETRDIGKEENKYAQNSFADFEYI